MMADARMEEAWNRTSHVIWAILEPSRDRKKVSRPYEPRDFTPYGKRRGRSRPTITVKMKDVKNILVGKPQQAMADLERLTDAR